MWRIWLVMLVGCVGHGSTPDANAFETDQFLPQICTDGPPDDPPDNPNPNCLVNRIPLVLDSFGVTGVTLELVATALGSSLFIDVTFHAATGGLHLEHVQVLRFPAGQPPIVLDPYPDVVVNFEGGRVSLGGVDIVGFVSGDKMALRFDTVGPFRP